MANIQTNVLFFTMLCVNRKRDIVVWRWNLIKQVSLNNWLNCTIFYEILNEMNHLYYLYCSLGARPFKCPVCGKTFTRSTNLNKHARVHSGRRPHSCEHCEKMFSSRGDLVRHAVIHTGAKPYACLICSLAFNRKDKLSRHERVHITDRTFVCAECPTSFHRKEELTKHIRFHHFKPVMVTLI